MYSFVLFLHAIARRPLFYRSLEISYSSRVRILSYILPTLVSSILLNIPKFLEARHDFVFQETENQTVELLIYNVTSLRMDPDYMFYYIHWTRLICTGLLPFTFLATMNALIYSKIRQNSISMVRSRAQDTKKAGNLATVLIVIGETYLKP